MKIYYDHHIFTQQKYGGISRYIYELSKNLEKIGQNSTIVAPIHINPYLKKNTNTVGWYIDRYPKFTNLLCRKVNSIVSQSYFMGKKEAILHETYYSEFSLAPKNILKIVTVHDMIHELFPNSFSEQDGTSILKKKAVERADHIICISECTKQDLIKILDIPENKISVVYHGVSELTGSQAIEINEPFFLYVGQRGGYKNFELLIQAFSKSNFFKNNFRIIAFGGGEFTREEHNLFRKLNLPLGLATHITGDDGLLKSLYQQAVALIYPSLYEGFGFPPLEAMSYRCPTIVSNVSSIPEVVGKAALLFNPNEVDDLIVSMESVIKVSVRDQLVNAGLFQCHKFTWEKCARETLQVYQSVSQ